MSRCTIKDIARLSGVSVTTVSRVLNDYRDVGAETKKRVLEVIEENGYVPNANAKNLKLVTSNVIAIIVKGKDNMFLSGLVAPIENSIPKNMFDVSVYYISENDNEYLFAKKLCDERRLEGIIFLGGIIGNHMNKDSYLDIPCVFATVDAERLDYPNVSSASIDNESAAKAAVNELIRRGHRNIAVIGGNCPDLSAIGKRYVGSMRAFDEAGITDYEKMIIPSKFTLKGGYKAMSEFIAEKIPFSAVFAMSDILAIAAVKACIDAGFSVPDDVSVIGFDGMKIARYYNPSIATVQQSEKELAEVTIKLLLDLIIRKQNAHITMPFKFESGGSIKTYEKA